MPDIAELLSKGRGVATTGATAPVFVAEPRPDSLVQYLTKFDEAARHAKLAVTPTPKLLDAYGTSVVTENEPRVILIGEELCRRNVAPVFRRTRSGTLPEAPRALLRMADLQWLRHRHPDHSPKWARLAGIFYDDDVQALKAWRYVVNVRALQVHHSKLLDGLCLGEAASLELASVVPASLQRRRTVALRNRVRASSAIQMKMDDSRDRRSEHEKADTLERRQLLWLCGTLCAWSPQRTADLYAFHPDRQTESISRASVARDFEFIHAALREYPRRMHAPSSQTDS